MKANEAEKSKFVYPDKLYARTNDNITLDISYAPQTLEAVEYTRTDAFIKKAVGRLKHYLDNSVWVANDVGVREKEVIIEDFENYLKGE